MERRDGDQIVYSLHLNGAQSLTVLAARCGREPGAVAADLASLAEAGLVRQVCVWMLTPAAQEVRKTEDAQGRLICAYGETGEGWEGQHHCYRCWQAVQDGHKRFLADKAAGKFDADGCTPAERKREERRSKHA